MEIQTETCGDVCVVRIAGRISSSVAGELCDHLVDQVRRGSGKLLVEIEPGSTVTCAGIRGFVVAASLARAARGDFRIVADAATEDFLHKFSFKHLLPVHRRRTSALISFSTFWPEKASHPAEPDAPANAPQRPVTCMGAVGA